MEGLNILPKIAKMAILEEFGREGKVGEKLIHPHRLIREYPFLAEKRATFVTLNLKGKGKGSSLRGCIGSIIPYRPLIEDVVENAKGAAFRDPRFPPLSRYELEQVEIEVSLLTIPKKIDYQSIEDLKAKITPFKDGVLLQLGNHTATFLPSVWEQLPRFDLFFSHLCLKGGLPAECLHLHPTIYIYQTLVIKEN